MAQRPVLLPDPFDGEKTSWPEWETHFEHVAAVNKWESADEKLKWLRVRLTGKAQAAFSRCSEAVRNDYGECMKALAKRFNPDSKREVYVAELHSRNRRKEEDWATYADILKGLADKAYPDLEEAARERLALNQFLGELDKPQVASSDTCETVALTQLSIHNYCRPINQFLHLMRGHDAAKMRHTYTLVWPYLFAEDMLRQITYKVHIFIEYSSLSHDRKYLV